MLLFLDHRSVSMINIQLVLHDGGVNARYLFGAEGKDIAVLL